MKAWQAERELERRIGLLILGDAALPEPGHLRPATELLFHLLLKYIDASFLLTEEEWKGRQEIWRLAGFGDLVYQLERHELIARFPSGGWQVHGPLSFATSLYANAKHEPRRLLRIVRNIEKATREARR